MPSECDLVNNTTVTQQLERKNFDNNMETLANRDSNGTDLMSTSQTSNTSSNGHSEHSNSNGGSRKASITSPDPTAYVAKARVTRPTPPPPSYNPMQFVQIKPCNLYQTAQEQLKKAEEVKKIKEIKKEEPEEWQNNLDNWKSSRRKRVEHIIDRVVEVKKLELEEHDRTRRKSKTFSEMIEERGERPPRPGLSKLVSLAVYNEDESNDLSDLGIGTSSASGKSSLSEDYDNNSVLSDNAELDKVIGHSKNGKTNGKMREYISSPGYDTSSSTAPGSSPDPCEYTYEGAIQDYKQRVSRAQANTTSNYNGNGGLKTMDNETTPTYPTRRGSKIEDRLIGFEVTSPSDSQEGAENKKVDVPKIDISKRKEIFEAAQNGLANKEPKQGITAPRVTLREHFKCETTNGEAPQSGLKKEAKRLSGDLGSIRNRLQSLETNVSANANAGTKVMDIPVPPLKERLSSLQNAVTKEEVKKAPVLLVDARQLEIMRKEDEDKIKQLQQLEETKQELQKDGNDSGIHTADNELEEQENAAACSEREQAKNLQELKEQEQQLNAAIAALAMEEKQLEEAAMAVNQIEAEFAELTTNTAAGAANDNDLPTQQACEMEFSVSSTNNLLSNINSSSLVVDKGGSSDRSNISSSSTEVMDTSKSINGNLRRKPSNEMVHARNLLKMFKETFQNDIELDENEEEELPISPPCSTPTSPPLKPKSPATVTFANASPIAIPQSPPPPNPVVHATTPCMIPRAIGKPPMSPKVLVRSNSRPLVFASPQNSPTLSRKNDGQFSINGRVEIFNSRNMITNADKPPTPTMTPKQSASHLPQITNKPNSATSVANEIILPQAQASTPIHMKASNLASIPLKVNNEAKENQKSATKSMPIQTDQQTQQPPTEVVMCAPPITIVNPDELPKPNTVKALSSCFAKEAVAPPLPPPRATARLRPQQSPTPAKRNFNDGIKTEQTVVKHPNDTPPCSPQESNVLCKNTAAGVTKPKPSIIPRNLNNSFTENIESKDSSPTSAKTLSSISSSSTWSSDTTCYTGPFEITAQVHRPASDNVDCPKANVDPLRPNAALVFTKPNERSEMPALLLCAPNESSLFKMASSTPSSPVSPKSQSSNQEFPNIVQQQHLIEKVEKEQKPAAAEMKKVTVSPSDKQNLDTDVALCSSFFDKFSCIPSKKPAESEDKIAIEEVQCKKLDVHTLPANKQLPCTGYGEVDDNQIKLSYNEASTPPIPPINEARAAHSKALIETCEKIIAEEKEASNQMKNTLSSSSPKSTPILQRKSKIPKPIQCCIGANDTLELKPAANHNSKAEVKAENPPQSKDEGPLVARLHVVETQIKVTTTTPPNSPKPTVAKNKKTKNIFDFLKKNFGHHQEEPAAEVREVVAPPPTTSTPTVKFKQDEIFNVDNSKFYLAAEDEVPPPLPKTPAPVNIEITKTITTDEILEENGLSQEMNDFLDDELNKL